MSGLFADARVNTGRQFEIDLVRTIAIVTMIFVHVFELVYPYLDTDVWFAYIIEFIGGPLSAPLFMTAMGVGLAYSRHQDPAHLMKRGFLLIILGYVLNVLRGTLPDAFGYLAFGDDIYLTYAWEDLICLDILQFAGLTFILFAFLRHLKVKDMHILIAAICMLAIATFVPIMFENSPMMSAVIGYLFYQTPYTAFPLFSWFIFPIAGYVFATYLMRVTDKRRFYRSLLLASAAVFALYTLLLFAIGYDIESMFIDDYYRQTLISAPWTLLICGMAYGALYFLSLLIKGMRSTAFIKFMSGKVTVIYIMQWTIIAWLYTFWFDGLAMDTLGFLLLAIAITVISILASYVWVKFISRQRPSRSANA